MQRFTTGRSGAEAGMPPRTVSVVVAVTRLPREAPDEYYRRVRASPDAVVVKRADIADNSSPVRLAALDPATRQRLTAKYARARAAIGS